MVPPPTSSLRCNERSSHTEVAVATFIYDSVGNMTVKNHEGSDPMSFTYNAFGQVVTVQQGAVLGVFT